MYLQWYLCGATSKSTRASRRSTGRPFSSATRANASIVEGWRYKLASLPFSSACFLCEPAAGEVSEFAVEPVAMPSIACGANRL